MKTAARRAPMTTKHKVLGVAAFVFAVPFAAALLVVLLSVAVVAVGVARDYLGISEFGDAYSDWFLAAVIALYYVGPVALVLAIPTFALGIPWFVARSRRPLVAPPAAARPCPSSTLKETTNA